MNRFVSTRGAPPASFTEALVRGLAPDGGLYVPERLGRLGSPPRAGRADLATMGAWAGRVLLDGTAAEERVGDITREALDFPAPLVDAAPDTWLLELFHGPTHAFKDVGARFMAGAMDVLAPPGGRRTVLVATSGDTGGAVASAFLGRPGIRVVVLFPAGGVSGLQRRQMTTLGGNVTAVAVEGTFDDCQRLAKEAFADAALCEAAGLTSANSINLGRLLPQTFYYLTAAASLGWGEPGATFVVPSGNLGNLCAGLMAHRMGMPASGFVAACNANRTFADFLASGEVRPRAAVPTLSNAMDVAVPSNLERIRWLYGDDLAALRRDVRAVSVDDAGTRRAMRDAYERSGRMLDPHTAVGWAAARDIEGPVVILATAHPGKFPRAVRDALGETPTLPASLQAALRREEHRITLPADLDSLRPLLLEASP